MRWLALLLIAPALAGCADDDGSPPVLIVTETELGKRDGLLRTGILPDGTVGSLLVRLQVHQTFDPDGDLQRIMAWPTVEDHEPVHDILCGGPYGACTADQFHRVHVPAAEPYYRVAAVDEAGHMTEIGPVPMAYSADGFHEGVDWGDMAELLVHRDREPCDTSEPAQVFHQVLPSRTTTVHIDAGQYEATVCDAAGQPVTPTAEEISLERLDFKGERTIRIVVQPPEVPEHGVDLGDYQAPYPRIELTVEPVVEDFVADGAA